MIDLMKELKNTFLEMIEEIGLRIAMEFDNIIILLYIMCPVFLSMFGLTFSGKVGLSVIFVFLLRYAENVQRNCRNELRDGMPLPAKRYTYIEDDLVILRDKEEALEYFATLEDYLEKKRLI